MIAPVLHNILIRVRVFHLSLLDMPGSRIDKVQREQAAWLTACYIELITQFKYQFDLIQILV